MRSVPGTGAAGAGWLALVASAGTLLCCALPIVLVSFGFGATVAALTSSIPVLVALAGHKAWLFGVSGALLFLAGWLSWGREWRCPSDPELARLCDRNRRWSRRVFKLALVLWGIGFFAAYLALPVRLWFDV